MANLPDAYGRDLDLNLLRVFVVVAEEGSITRAAARLYVTQPAVSAAMRRLTTIVGAALFTRQGRGIALTSRGATLAAAARSHLGPLVAAALAGPVFDPRVSTATVRLGLADGLETVLLPALSRQMRTRAPAMQLVVVPVQFRTVEALLLTGQIELAVTVADELPRSIRRQTLTSTPGFVCLYDPRFVRLPRKLTEREYFAHEHVVVSYAADARGIVEDALGKARRVRLSVPTFGHVAGVVDGSPLIATIPRLFASSMRQLRPHLRTVPTPFELASAEVELLWSSVTDDDAAVGFVRGLVVAVARTTLNRPAR